MRPECRGGFNRDASVAGTATVLSIVKPLSPAAYADALPVFPPRNQTHEQMLPSRFALNELNVRPECCGGFNGDASVAGTATVLSIVKPLSPAAYADALPVFPPRNQTDELMFPSRFALNELDVRPECRGGFNGDASVAGTATVLSIVKPLSPAA